MSKSGNYNLGEIEKRDAYIQELLETLHDAKFGFTRLAIGCSSFTDDIAWNKQHAAVLKEFADEFIAKMHGTISKAEEK